jgi:hypothetical protein
MHQEAGKRKTAQHQGGLVFRGDFVSEHSFRTSSRLLKAQGTVASPARLPEPGTCPGSLLMLVVNLAVPQRQSQLVFAVFASWVQLVGGRIGKKAGRDSRRD